MWNPRNLWTGNNTRTELSDQVMTEIRKSARSKESDDRIDVDGITTVWEIASTKLFEFLESDEFEVTLDDRKKRINISVSWIELWYFSTSPRWREKLVLLLTDLYDYAIDMENLQAIKNSNDRYTILAIQTAEIPIIKNEVADYLDGIYGEWALQKVWNKNPVSAQKREEIRDDLQAARKAARAAKGENKTARGTAAWLWEQASQQWQGTALNIVSWRFRLDHVIYDQLSQEVNQIVEKAETTWPTAEITMQLDKVEAKLIRALADTYARASQVNYKRWFLWLAKDEIDVFNSRAENIYKSFWLEPRWFVIQNISNDRRFKKALAEKEASLVVAWAWLYKEKEIRKSLLKLAVSNWQKNQIRADLKLADKNWTLQKVAALWFVKLKWASMSPDELRRLAGEIPSLAGDIDAFINTWRTNINPFSDLIKYERTGWWSGTEYTDGVDESAALKWISFTMNPDGTLRKSVNFSEVWPQLLVDTYTQVKANAESADGPLWSIGEFRRISAAMIDYAINAADNDSAMNSFYEKLWDGSAMKWRTEFLDMFAKVYFTEEGKKAVAQAFYSEQKSASVNWRTITPQDAKIWAFVSVIQRVFPKTMSKYVSRRDTNGFFTLMWSDREKILGLFKTFGKSDLAGYVDTYMWDINETTYPRTYTGTGNWLTGKWWTIDTMTLDGQAYLTEAWRPTASNILGYMWAWAQIWVWAFRTGSYIWAGVMGLKTVWNVWKNLLSWEIVKAWEALRDWWVWKRKEWWKRYQRSWPSIGKFLAFWWTVDILEGNVGKTTNSLVVEVWSMLGYYPATEELERRKEMRSWSSETIWHQEVISMTYGDTKLKELTASWVLQPKGDAVEVHTENLSSDQMSKDGLWTLNSTQRMKMWEAHSLHLLNEYGLTSATLWWVMTNYPNITLNQALERYDKHSQKIAKLDSVLPDKILDDDNKHLISYLDDVKFEQKLSHLAFAAQQWNKINTPALLGEFKTRNWWGDYLWSADNLLSQLSTVTSWGVSAKQWIEETLMGNFANVNLTETSDITPYMESYFSVLYSAFASYPQQKIITWLAKPVAPSTTGVSATWTLTWDVSALNGSGENTAHLAEMSAMWYGDLKYSDRSWASWLWDGKVDTIPWDIPNSILLPSFDIDQKRFSLADYFHDPRIGNEDYLGDDKIPTLWWRSASPTISYNGVSHTKIEDTEVDRTIIAGATRESITSLPTTVI